MFWRVILGGALLLQAAYAQTALEAAKDSRIASQASSASGPGFPLMQLVVITLVIVGLFKFAAPKIKSWNQTSGPAAGAVVKVSQSVPAGPAQIHVIEVDGERFLIGTTPNSVQLISKLGPPPVDPPAFFEMVDEAMAVVEVPTEPTKEDRLHELLNRISR